MKVYRPSDNQITGNYTSTHRAYDFAGNNVPDLVRAGQNGTIIERVDLYSTNWINTGTLTTKDYGNYIKIRHDDGTFELHAHLRLGSSFIVGTKVTAGQTVARIGNTGNSTGPHLHSEYRNASNINEPAEFYTSVTPTPVPSVEPLPLPNPGYAPTFEGQTVTKDGVTYKAYKDPTGKLLWKIEPVAPPTNWEQKYNEEVAAHKLTKERLEAVTSRVNELRAKITAAKTALE